MFGPDLLSGRVALITGGGSGIGLEIAMAYSQLGAAVSIVGRDEKRLQSAKELLQVSKSRVATFVADVRDYEKLDLAVKSTVDQFGSLDILVNNAAGNFFCPTSEMSPKAWKAVVDIDLNGTFHGCRSAYQHLKSSRYGGCIISIITMHAESGWPGAAHAAAAKAGILSLSKTLAVEWGPDSIRVNTISPGPIGDTEGVRRMYIETGRAQEQIDRTALGRFGTKREVANAAIFLASDLASYVTGENLIVDGGRWLKHVSRSVTDCES